MYNQQSKICIIPHNPNFKTFVLTRDYIKKKRKEKDNAKKVRSPCLVNAMYMEFIKKYSAAH